MPFKSLPLSVRNDVGSFVVVGFPFSFFSFSLKVCERTCSIEKHLFWTLQSSQLKCRGVGRISEVWDVCFLSGDWWESCQRDRLWKKVWKGAQKRGGLRHCLEAGKGTLKELCCFTAWSLRCGPVMFFKASKRHSETCGVLWDVNISYSGFPASSLARYLIFLFLCLLAGVVYWLKLFPYGCNVELDYIKRGAFLWHCSAMRSSSLFFSLSNLPFFHRILFLECGTC